MQYIYNEIPSWVVNWVNKIFTVINNIGDIEEVFIWGVAYRNLSFLWNVITLVEAPPLWSAITVDYFLEELNPPLIEWTVTLWTIINDCYSKIGQDRIKNGQANRTYPEAQIKLQIVSWLQRIKNLRTYKDRIMTYSFNKANEFAAIWYEAAFVKIGTQSHVPSSWVYVLNKSTVVEYPTYTGWNLNWIPWVVYQSWAEVRVGYRVPSWVKKISEIFINWQPLEYKDYREYSFNSWYYYTILHSSNNSYIILPRTWKEDLVAVRYVAKLDDAALDADIVDIEYEYFELLSYYALYRLFQIREDERWQIMEKEYRDLLSQYKSYKSRAVDWINNKIKSNVLRWF